jgi:hypothetical protein
VVGARRYRAIGAQRKVSILWCPPWLFRVACCMSSTGPCSYKFIFEIWIYTLFANWECLLFANGLKRTYTSVLLTYSCKAINDVC